MTIAIMIMLQLDVAQIGALLGVCVWTWGYARAYHRALMDQR